jgi:ribosomal protein L15
MDYEEIDKVIGNGKVPSIKAIVSPCDNMDYEEIDKVIGNGKVPSIKAIVVMPATVTPKKRKLVAHTSSMDNDSLEIVTRAKGLAASRAKSICLESGKKNEE